MLGTDTITQRIYRSDIDLWVAWYRAVRALEGDPFGIDIRRFGRAVALVTLEVPIGRYNKVMGLEGDDHALIPHIVSFYRERMLPCRFETGSFSIGGKLERAISSEGFLRVERRSQLFGKPLSALRERPREGVEVHEVDGEDLDRFADLFARAYYDGEPIPPRLVAFRAAGVRARAGHPGWRYFLCTVDGRPAGGGMLWTSGDLATLCGGAVLQRYRGRGCHRALLDHRRLAATEMGCDLVVSRCVTGSASERNMLRAGMRLAFANDVWEPVGFTFTKAPAA